MFLSIVCGFEVNTTESLPQILWISLGKKSEIQKGEYVKFCPKLRSEFVERHYIQKGNCPLGGLPLVKKVFATNDDLISLSKSGIAVNSIPITNTVILEKDSEGRDMYVDYREFTVQANQLFVLSNQHKNSFDSRYFGAITKEQVLSTMLPIF